MFCKNYQRLNTVSYFCKSFILDVSLGSEYVSHYRIWIRLCFHYYYIFHFESTKFRSSHLQMSFKIDAFKNFTIFTGKHLCWSVFVIKLPDCKPVNLLKRDFNTSVFLLILLYFSEQLFLQNTFGSCFLKLCLKPGRSSPWRTKKTYNKLLGLLY